MLRISTLLFAAASVWAAGPSNLSGLKAAFANPPDDARIMMRWWWFGPAVEKQEIERELRVMKQGGIGGVEVQPVYPLELDDPARGFRNLPYGSPGFLDMLRFTGEKARELGMRMDITLGSGWPYGGPHIPITEASGRLRWDRVAPKSRRVPLPARMHGESFIAAFSADTKRELHDIRDGVLWLPESDPLPNEVWFFIAGRTGMQVKRPSVGAEGFVLDHYSRTAIENHLRTVADPMMRALGENRPYAVFCDSLEVYGADWTGDFLEEFRKRRGYDLKPHLPALVSETGAETRRIRHDWGRTLTELYEERFMTPLRDWAKAHETRFRIQGYGLPPATISSNAVADLPEGEGSQWKVLRASRWAASASHIYGGPVTSSETWTWLHSPAFRATPLDIKAEADLHFLQGINQLVGHGWPYTPPGEPYPGWRFYAAAVFDEKNPWWIVMPELSRYLQRISFLLRQGRPANDVALYLPNADGWAHLAPGRVHLIETLRELIGPDVVAKILDAGYGLDFFDDGALESVGRVEGNRLLLGQNPYRIVVLPGVETMPASTIRKLDEFIRGGGVVIATRRLPDSAPGLNAAAADSEYVRVTAGKLQLVRDEAHLGDALHAALAPDLALSPTVPEIGFVHRSAPFAELYFVANSSNQRQRVRATFHAGELEPEQWDAMTGEAAAGQVLARGEGAVTLALDLEPYGSRVVVFSKHRSGNPAPGQTGTGVVLADLSSGWTVRFGDSGPVVNMDRLRSWTEDEHTRFFSGVATYERDFDAPATGGRYQLNFGEGTAIEPGALRNGMRTWLDPPVREAAVVYVNSTRAGTLWCPPYVLDISNLVKAGRNHLRVEVANLALNYMSGRPLPSYRLLNLRYGVRFEPQDMDQVQPIAAGLLGPIQLTR
jgi:hypothetical protein